MLTIYGEIEKEEEGEGRGVKHGGDIYSGGERRGAELEILADSVRVLHIAQHGENYWTNIIWKRYQRRKDHIQYIGICLYYVWSVLQVRSL